MSRSAGLVGLPNVGKSTLFNALIAQQLALASNFPFTTISPNVASAVVPDARLDALATLSATQRTVRQVLELHDIAGLIEGASKGEGLGNAFLANIRTVNSIVHVLRAYEDPDIIHVLSTEDAVRDLLIIENELTLADLQRCETTLQKQKRGVTGEAATSARLLAAASKLLEAGLPARLHAPHLAPSEVPLWHKLGLLTAKPQLLVCNVAVEHAVTGNDMTRAVEAFVAARNAGTAPGTGGGGGRRDRDDSSIALVCAKLEEDVSQLPAEERPAFLAEFGLACSGLDAILQRTADMLRLQVFYTTGVVETRAWPIPVGATASQAAG